MDLPDQPISKGILINERLTSRQCKRPLRRQPSKSQNISIATGADKKDLPEKPISKEILIDDSLNPVARQSSESPIISTARDENQMDFSKGLASRPKRVPRRKPDRSSNVYDEENIYDDMEPQKEYENGVFGEIDILRNHSRDAHPINIDLEEMEDYENVQVIVWVPPPPPDPYNPQ